MCNPENVINVQDEVGEASLLRQLYEATSLPGESFSEKVQKLLALGQRWFGLDTGILSQVEGDLYTVRYLATPYPSMQAGTVYSISDTYCEQTIQTGKPIGFSHASETGWKNHPCYTKFKLEAYLGIPLLVGGKAYGTLNFSSLFPREVPFTDADTTILRLMVQWIEQELERQEAEKRLHQMQKLESLGTMAAGIAHDFNNLLVVILGQTSVALSLLSEANRAHPHIQKAVKAAQQASELTQQLLAYSGRGYYNFSIFDLNVHLREHEHLFDVVLPHNVRLSLTLSDSPLLLHADPGQIQQVITNLVLNAAEAIGEQTGWIAVETEMVSVGNEARNYGHRTALLLESDTYISLKVSDNGIGMDEETVSKIFDPFYTTKSFGNGLGLATVLGIIRTHKGGLEVQSRKGIGTSFHVLLPLAKDEPPAPNESKITQGDETESGVVLLIDDDEVVRGTVKDILESEGVQVLAVPNSEEAMNVIHENRDRIRLILIEMDMSKEDRQTVMDRMQNNAEDIPIILSTSYDFVETIEHLNQQGFADFIQKPYDATVLVRTVKQYLDASEST